MGSERTRLRRPSHNRPKKKPRISPPVDTHAESSESDLEGAESDSPEEKDETEQKLESLVFGDQTGFHDALKSYEQKTDAQFGLDIAHGQERGVDYPSDAESEDGVVSDALAGLADDDLFFVDYGAGPAASKELDTLHGATGGDDSVNLAAWEDSDDERISIPLAGHSRLRKLRVVDGEDVVSGREYVKRLRLQYERLHPPPDWVRQLSSRGDGRKGLAQREHVLSDASGSDSDEDTGMDKAEALALPPLAKLLQNTEGLTVDHDGAETGGRAVLRQGVIDIQRLKDVGGSQPSSVDSLSFHPHYPLLLSSGPASTLYLHHVSPQSSSPNPLITSLHIRRTPIRTSALCPPTGNRIIFSGRRRFFHIWDLDTGKISKVHGSVGRKEEQKSMEQFKPSPCGRWIGFVGTSRKGGGVINIVNTSTGQWVGQLRVDSRGGVADFAWWSDGEGITAAGKNGEVSEWDGRLKRVVSRWTDQGAVGTTVLSLGGQSGPSSLGGDRWVAIGSSSGVVNVYDRRSWASAPKRGGTESQPAVPENPKPTRVLDQLTTPISHVVFSADGQLLVIGSRWKKDALRLVHLPSCTVYQNWPTSSTPLGRISSVAVSPKSDLLGVANEQGKIRLWQIHA